MRARAAAVLAIAAAGGLAFVAVRTDALARLRGGLRSDSSPGETSTSADVRAEPFLRRIPGTGALRSSDSISVGCPVVRRTWQFTITSMADEGTVVKEGTPILSFDAKALVDRLQVLRSRLDTAVSELERTRIKEGQEIDNLTLESVELEAKTRRLERKLAVPAELQARIELDKLRLDMELAREERRLLDQRLAARHETHDSAVRRSENRISTLERMVESVESGIAAMTVRASRDGHVVHVADWNGNKPKVGETVWAGRAVIELANLSQMELAAAVAERDAQHVQVGQRAEFRLDAAPDRVFTGEVRSLGRLFHPKSDDVPAMVFDVVVSIDEPDPDLMRPGMTARLEMLSKTEHAVIAVDESIVARQGSGHAVRVMRAGRVETVAVSLGDRWQGRVIVEHGLREGDRVLEPADES